MPPIDGPDALRASPELFPLTLDPASDRVRLVRLSAVDYEKASFLDERLALPAAAEVAYAEVAAVMLAAPVACDVIFHTGHVGSTLLSRLLGTHPAIFSLREPQVLRTLAAAEAAGRPWPGGLLDARLRTFLALFSRTWTPGKRALVKATSFVSGLAPRLMAQAPDARAILLSCAPETFLAAIFSGANFGDVRQAAALRLARLHAALGAAPWRLDALSPGELTAMSLAADLVVFAKLPRSLRLDFDAFLAAPQAGLAAALEHLRADPAQAARLAASPYLQRYSKAPEYAYGPELRRQVLAEARAAAGGEIARGLKWLEAAGRDWPLIAEALPPSARPREGGDPSRAST